MNKIIVYSKAGCGQCVVVKKALESLKVDFEEKRIDLAPADRDRVIELGFRTLPVVEIPGVMALGNPSVEDLKANLKAFGYVS